MSRTDYLLFDWYAGGHHGVYLHRFVEVLGEHAKVTVATARENIEPFGDLPAETRELPSRPVVATSRHFSPTTRETGRREVALLKELAAETRAAHVIHMFADGSLRWLGRRPGIGAPTTVLIFRPRLHYPAMYGTPLTAAERVTAFGHELVLARWRRLPEAHAVMTLDEGVVPRWNERPGAPAHWLPEPPVTARHVRPTRERSGCLMLGGLSRRKGIHLLARALSISARAIPVRLVGPIQPGFEPELHGHVALMRSGGIDVEVRAGPFTEPEGLEQLASARCVVIPYVGHIGMSRVLLEACAVGTPIVSTDRGLIGHLVCRYGLGLAVDAADGVALQGAIRRFTDSAAAVAQYQPALASFAQRFSEEAFRTALLGALEPPTVRSSSKSTSTR